MLVNFLVLAIATYIHLQGVYFPKGTVDGTVLPQEHIENEEMDWILKVLGVSFVITFGMHPLRFEEIATLSPSALEEPRLQVVVVPCNLFERLSNHLHPHPHHPRGIVVLALLVLLLCLTAALALGWLSLHHYFLGVVCNILIFNILVASNFG